MNVAQMYSYIDAVSAYGSSYGLDTIGALLKRLHQPQNQLKFVHVAGTNGKGSILAYTASTLTSAGYRTGRYISPSVFSYCERFQIDGVWINEETLAEYFSKVAPVCQAMKEDGLPHPTIFEIELAVALLYFVDMRCDIVLLETGLGGRLDATNIIQTPLVCAIASIGLDHTALLGNTLGEIAAEKAGILKENVPVVSALQKEEALAVLKQHATDLHCPFILVDDSALTPLETSLEGQTFLYQGETYSIGLLGPHQLINAACAIELLQCLNKQGFSLSAEQIKQGLAQAKWPGRFERIAQNPDVLIDGAHNPDGALRLMESLSQYYPGKKPIFILNIFQDKDYRQILQITAPFAQKIFTAAANNPRALSATALRDLILPLNEQVQACASLKEAVTEAYAYANADDVIVAFGSLSHLGEIRNLVDAIQGGQAHD